MFIPKTLFVRKLKINGLRLRYNLAIPVRIRASRDRLHTVFGLALPPNLFLRFLKRFLRRFRQRRLFLRGVVRKLVIAPIRALLRHQKCISWAFWRLSKWANSIINERELILAGDLLLGVDSHVLGNAFSLLGGLDAGAEEAGDAFEVLRGAGLGYGSEGGSGTLEWAAFTVVGAIYVWLLMKRGLNLLYWWSCFSTSCERCHLVAPSFRWFIELKRRAVARGRNLIFYVAFWFHSSTLWLSS